MTLKKSVHWNNKIWHILEHCRSSLYCRRPIFFFDPKLINQEFFDDILKHTAEAWKPGNARCSIWWGSVGNGGNAMDCTAGDSSDPSLPDFCLAYYSGTSAVICCLALTGELYHSCCHQVIFVSISGIPSLSNLKPYSSSPKPGTGVAKWYPPMGLNSTFLTVLKTWEDRPSLRLESTQSLPLWYCTPNSLVWSL